MYEVADAKGGRHAVKVITKSSLNSKKSKTKVRGYSQTVVR